MVEEEKPPVQALTVFLLKMEVQQYKDALDDQTGADLRRVDLQANIGFEGAFFVAPQQKRPPKWLEFVRDGIVDELDDLYNASTKAVLFIRADDRILAYVFGYGRSLLDPNLIERAFGLRVVLNTVDEKQLRSVDSKTIQELTLHTRRQTSRSSTLSDLSIDTEEEILGAVTGVPRDEMFARVVSGLDALQFRARIRFRDLGEKSLEILKAYRSDAYKAHGFGFVDHVTKVTDPTVINALDQALLNCLNSRNLDQIHMAPPEIIDWTSTSGFSYTPKGNVEPDLDVNSFLQAISAAGDLTVDKLKKQRYIYLHVDGASEAKKAWSVYRALVAEVEYNKKWHVLSGGAWYEIEKDFADSIRGKADAIEAADLGFPPAYPRETEPAYNGRVAEALGVALIDKKCPRVDGDPIEPCDFFTARRQFVHVKRWKASSTLSHLFAQGRVAAEAFLWDDEFRASLGRILRDEGEPSLAADIPTERPEASQYQVVFAIIKGGKHSWDRPLPFFTELHLVRTAEALRRLGFGVRLEKIGVEETGRRE